MALTLRGKKKDKAGNLIDGRVIAGKATLRTYFLSLRFL